MHEEVETQKQIENDGKSMGSVNETFILAVMYPAKAASVMPSINAQLVLHSSAAGHPQTPCAVWPPEAEPPPREVETPPVQTTVAAAEHP